MCHNQVKEGIIKGFFAGRLDHDLLFPFPGITDEESVNLGMLLENLQSCMHQSSRDLIDFHGPLPPEVFRGLADAGIFSMVIPGEYDGYGFSMYSCLKAIEYLGTKWPALSLAIALTHFQGINAVKMFGTEEQKRQFLPSFCDGEGLFSWAGCGENTVLSSDSIEMKATFVEGHENVVIDGRQKWVMNIGLARYFIVLARTGGEQDECASAFIIPSDNQGVSLVRSGGQCGIPGLDAGELILEQVRIPRKNIVGRPGQGLAIAKEVMAEVRLAQSASCLGAMKAIGEWVLEDAKILTRSGKPLLEYDDVRQLVAEMRTHIYVLENCIQFLAGSWDRSDTDLSAEIAGCKVFSSLSLWHTASSALQLFGLEGYVSDHLYEAAQREGMMHLLLNGKAADLLSAIALTGLAIGESMVSGPDCADSSVSQNPYSTFREVSRSILNNAERLFSVTWLVDAGSELYYRYINPQESGTAWPAFQAKARALETSIHQFSTQFKSHTSRMGQSPARNGVILRRAGLIALDFFLCSTLLSRFQNLQSTHGCAETDCEQTMALEFIDKALQRIESGLNGFSSTSGDNCREFIYFH